MRLRVDGRIVPIPPDVYGLMLVRNVGVCARGMAYLRTLQLNINSYAGGADLFGPDGDEHFAPQSSHDGLLEVAGVSGTFHLGSTAVGLARGTRIAQGSELLLELVGEHCIYYQIDGEPAPQPLRTPAVVRLRPLAADALFLAPDE